MSRAVKVFTGAVTFGVAMLVLFALAPSMIGNTSRPPMGPLQTNEGTAISMHVEFDFRGNSLHTRSVDLDIEVFLNGAKQGPTYKARVSPWTGVVVVPRGQPLVVQVTQFEEFHVECYLKKGSKRVGTFDDRDTIGQLECGYIGE